VFIALIHGQRCVSETHESVGVYWASSEDRSRMGEQIRPSIERTAERFGGWSVENHPERATAVVLQHVDHTAIKVGILKRGSSNEQSALCGWGSDKHLAIVPEERLDFAI
jgi:hypothetical protein